MWEARSQTLGLHLLFYSSWDQRQIEVWPQVFKAFPSFLTTACLIGPKLFQARQLLSVGNWVSNWLKPCLPWMSVHAACASAPLPSCNTCQECVSTSKVTPSLEHQNCLVDAWQHFGWSAWALPFLSQLLKALFGAFIYLIRSFIYLLLSCLWATGGDKSHSLRFFKLLESYEAGGSANWSLFFSFLFYFISHIVFNGKYSPL